MFGISWIKILVTVAVLGSIGGFIYGAFQYVEAKNQKISELTADNATLKANVATLESAVATQQQTIESQQRDASLQQQVLTDTFDKFELSRNRVNDLVDRLGRHELDFLAENRPGLVQPIINRGSDNILRCFEIASGADLTTAEINAILPSEINTECPDLANPNYRGDR
jgi:outer membrane murein-binding lipoprotein Lpp